MKTLPYLDPDKILDEVKEWLVVIRDREANNNERRRGVMLATSAIMTEEIYKPVLTYLKINLDTQSALNIMMANSSEFRGQIENGISFVPLFLEMVSIGYEIGKRERDAECVKSNTSVSS